MRIVSSGEGELTALRVSKLLPQELESEQRANV